jgi:hypothetical protein
MKRIRVSSLVAVTCASFLSHAIPAAPATPNRPRFRGPNLQGVAEDAKPPLDFGLGWITGEVGQQ